MKKLSILIVICILEISSFSQGLNDIYAPTNNLVYAQLAAVSGVQVITVLFLYQVILELTG